MYNLKVIIAILAFCLCGCRQVSGYSPLQIFNDSGISLVIPSSNSISYGKVIYGLCKDDEDNTNVQCNIYANSTQFGANFMESCPIELSTEAQNNSYILTNKRVFLTELDKVMLVWFEGKDDEDFGELSRALLHIYLIDMKSCDVVKNATVDLLARLYRPSRMAGENDVSISFLDDGSFEVGYIYENPHATDLFSQFLPYYIVYDKYFNVKIPAQLRNIPDDLKSKGSLYNRIDLFGLFSRSWLPISLAKGHFYVTLQGKNDRDYNPLIKLSVFTPENKVKITKNLVHLDDVRGASYGHENFAYCAINDKKSSLRCSMLDSELNVVYNVSLHPGFGIEQVHVFVFSHNEMIVLVSDKFKMNTTTRTTPDKLHLNARAYTINSKAQVSKPLVINGYNDYRRGFYQTNYEHSEPHLSLLDDYICFHFPALGQQNQGYIIESCQLKNVLFTFQ